MVVEAPEYSYPASSPAHSVNSVQCAANYSPAIHSLIDIESLAMHATIKSASNYQNAEETRSANSTIISEYDCKAFDPFVIRLL
jgi:hypothetical protein